MTSTQPSDMGLAHVTSVKTYATKETEISAMGTMYTMNESALLRWESVFVPEAIGRSSEDMNAYDKWLVAGDLLAFSEPDLDAILLYDMPTEGQPSAAQEVSLPWDVWHLTPDGKHIVYSEGDLLNVYNISEHRIVKSDLLKADWETSSQTNQGFVITTRDGDLLLWRKDADRPEKVAINQFSQRTGMERPRCQGVPESPWACVFTQTRGGPGLISVFNTETSEGRTVPGIGAQIAMLNVHGKLRPVIVSMNRLGNQLKLSASLLYITDDTRPELFQPITIGLPENVDADGGLVCNLLIEKEGPCIIVLLSSLNAERADATVYDARSGEFIVTESIAINLAETKTDLHGRILQRLPDGEIRRLAIDPQRFQFHRRQPST